MLLSAAAAVALSISSFAASPTDGVSVSVVVDRDSGITPSGHFAGINGLDNKTYPITASEKGWFTDWQYRWAGWSSSASLFGFKSFSGYIEIPVNLSVPKSSTTTFYVPDFYFVAGFSLNSTSFDYADLYFRDPSNEIIKVVPVKCTIDNNIVGFDQTSFELGEGSWIVDKIVVSFVIDTIVLTGMSQYFGISGFEFSMTTSLSVSEFISQQTQDIIKNDVLPAVNNMNQSINDVNSSVEDVNQSVQAVGEAVKQGNQKLTELNNAVNDLPDDIVSALDKKAAQEVDDLTNAADEALDELKNLIFGDGGFKFDTFTAALDSLKSSFTSSARADSITFPAGRMPNFNGGTYTLWEEQEVDIKGMINNFPTVFVTIFRSIFSIIIIVAIIRSLMHFLDSLINADSEESEE